VGFVVDPADGKVPMPAWAEVKRRENRAKYIDLAHIPI
jgi:hypothetical protein